MRGAAFIVGPFVSFLFLLQEVSLHERDFFIESPKIFTSATKKYPARASGASALPFYYKFLIFRIAEI